MDSKLVSRLNTFRNLPLDKLKLTYLDLIPANLAPDCEKENHRLLWLTCACACFKGARFAAASISVEVFGSIVQVDT